MGDYIDGMEGAKKKGHKKAGGAVEPCPLENGEDEPGPVTPESGNEDPAETAAEPPFDKENAGEQKQDENTQSNSGRNQQPEAGSLPPETNIIVKTQTPLEETRKVPPPQADSLEMLADQAVAGGKARGAVSELRVGDQVFYGISGEVVAPPNTELTFIMSKIPKDQIEPWLGGCAEMKCLDKALNSNIPSETLKGATIRTINIGGTYNRKHKQKKPACKSCRHVLKYLEIEEV